LKKTWAGKSHDYRDAIVFEKLRFQNISRAQENAKPSFSNFSGLKSVFEKLRFRDGLVWTVGQTVKTNLRFASKPKSSPVLFPTGVTFLRRTEQPGSSIQCLAEKEL